MGNAYTISMHQESAGKGKVHQAHNRRDEKAIINQDHIDRNGHYEIWIDKNIKDFYHETFDDAVKEFNARQKNKDRCIVDYYAHIAKGPNKQQVAYEAILQVGDKDWHPEDKVCREILKEYIDTWNDRNPNLKLVGAYYHADEATPHLHVDYVPVCESNRGMSLQNGLNGALKQQGVVKEPRHKHLGSAWWEQECNRLEDICRSRGLDIERGVTEKGRKHKEQELFKLEQRAKDVTAMLEREMQATSDTKQERAQLQADIAVLEADKARKQREYDRMGKLGKIGPKKDKIKVNRDEWERVLEYANNSAEIDNRQAVKDAEQMAKDKDLAQRQAQLNAQQAQIEADRRNLDILINQKAKELTKGLTADYEKQIRALQEREAHNIDLIQYYEQTDDRVVREFKLKEPYIDSLDEKHEITIQYTIGDLRKIATGKILEGDFVHEQYDSQVQDIEDQIKQQRRSCRSRDDDDWER